MGKLLYRGMLALYVGILIWLVLFKFSHHISSVLHSHQRSLNLVPFGAPKMVGGKPSYAEVVFNCVSFIPFGLLLSVNFKKTGFFWKLLFMFLFSVAVEWIQYVFSIGATDITDVIANTTGALLGLILYEICKRFMKTEVLDRIIFSIGTVLFILFLSVQMGHFRTAYR